MERMWRFSEDELLELRTLVEQGYVSMIRELAATDDRAFRQELRTRLNRVERLRDKLNVALPGEETYA